MILRGIVFVSFSNSSPSTASLQAYFKISRSWFYDRAAFHVSGLNISFGYNPSWTSRHALLGWGPEGMEAIQLEKNVSLWTLSLYELFYEREHYLALLVALVWPWPYHECAVLFSHCVLLRRLGATPSLKIRKELFLSQKKRPNI